MTKECVKVSKDASVKVFRGDACSVFEEQLEIREKVL